MFRTGWRICLSNTSERSIYLRHTFKKVGERCNAEKCKFLGKKCYQISDQERKQIFEEFNSLGDLTEQRHVLLKHVQVVAKKKITTPNMISRRQNTRIYSLTVRNNKLKVCKKLFFNTLGVPERAYRSAILKVSEMGVLAGEERGSRQRRFREGETGQKRNRSPYWKVPTGWITLLSNGYNKGIPSPRFILKKNVCHVWDPNEKCRAEKNTKLFYLQEGFQDKKPFVFTPQEKSVHPLFDLLGKKWNNNDQLEEEIWTPWHREDPC